MKRFCGLLVVSSLAVIGCTRAAEAPAAPPAPAYVAHGTLLQVMRAIPFPASNIVFDMQTNDPGKPAKPSDTSGASATAQYGGIAAYAGWNAVENAGVALQETANLLMIPGRKCGNGQPVPNDQEDFKKWAADLAAVGAEVTKFAQAKTFNEDAVIDITGKVSDACAGCHDKYRNTPKEPEDRCLVSAAPAAAK